MQDYIIVGGGVVGSFLAYELSKYNKKITLIEKEKDLALVQTKHNSALVHSPVMVPPNKGALKAKLALEGNLTYQTLAEKLGVPHLKNGAYVLAVNEEEKEILKDLLSEAKSRNLNAELLDDKTLRKREKNISKSVVAGLFLKDAMTADTFKLCQVLEKLAKNNGVTFKKQTEVNAIKVIEEGFLVKTMRNDHLMTKHVINASGVKAEEIAKMVETTVPYKMMPHRGEYMVLPEKYRGFVTSTFFPVPKKDTKGVLVIPQPDGTIRLGPTSVYQDSLDESPVTEEGLNEIKQTINQLINYVPYKDIERTYAGVRSTIDQDDFYIARSKEHPNFIHVAGIDSPGVTAAPGIARYVREDILNLQ